MAGVQEFCAEVGIDPAELRRRNFLQPADFPYETPTGVTYDTGNYPASLERALDIVGYDLPTSALR